MAVLTLRNDLVHLDLNDLAVVLSIRDASGLDVPWTSSPDGTGAVFFVRQDRLEGVTSVDGAGRVAAGGAAEVRWLLIPSPGAGGAQADGVRYEVGARLSYTLAGARYESDLIPDSIQVVPMPDLQLDLFIPEWVPGDDPRTPALEPSPPFPVGLRILNTGAGTASRVTLSLGQPRIVDNRTGLLVDFLLRGCDVDGSDCSPSLQAVAGNIAPQAASVVRWWMTCSLAGAFVGVDVGATHADELGGTVTALIRSERTRVHRLRKDVLVDLPGRDARADFLSIDGVLYESDGLDGVCADASAAASVATDGDTVTVRLPSAGGFVYAGIPLPPGRWSAGGVAVRSAIRADGMRVRGENAWTEVRRNAMGAWEPWLGVFDHAPAGVVEYRIDLRAANPNRAPCFLPVSGAAALTGRQLTFRVEAFDPDGTRPTVSASALPAGAAYAADGVDGGWVTWTPSEGQAGTYRLKFAATDGELAASLWVPVTVAIPDAIRGALFLFR